MDLYTKLQDQPIFNHYMYIINTEFGSVWYTYYNLNLFCVYLDVRSKKKIIIADDRYASAISSFNN